MILSVILCISRRELTDQANPIPARVIVIEPYRGIVLM